MDLRVDGVEYWVLRDLGCGRVLGISLAKGRGSDRCGVRVCPNLHGINQSHIDSCTLSDGESGVSAQRVFLEGDCFEFGIEHVDPTADVSLLYSLGD